MYKNPFLTPRLAAEVDILLTSDKLLTIFKYSPDTTKLSTYCFVTACKANVGSAFKVKKPVIVPPDKLNFVAMEAFIAFMVGIPARLSVVPPSLVRNKCC